MKFRSLLGALIVVVGAVALLALGMRYTVHPCAFVERADLAEWDFHGCGAVRGDPPAGLE